jgi:hypothetical protein
MLQPIHGCHEQNAEHSRNLLGNVTRNLIFWSKKGDIMGVVITQAMLQDVDDISRFLYALEEAGNVACPATSHMYARLI